MKRIQIFRPGRHTAMSGASLQFSEADLEAAAAAYDPELHEAPIVAGHPRHDAPAYGWVGGLAYSEGSLEAEPRQVDPAFAELVRDGRFKKVSASFYHPEAKTNPKPGVYYLRHLGFLGAQPPALKGLRQVEFGDAEADLVTFEFGEADVGILRGLLRRLREWIIARHGTEEADRVIPDYAIEDLERERPESVAEPMYSEKTEVSDVDKAEVERREREIAEREQRIKEQEAAFAEREQTIAQEEAKRRRAEHAARVDKLVEAGRVLPRDRDALVEFLEAQDAEAVVEFGEGAEAVKKPAREWFLEFLERLPQAIDYGERGARRESESGKVPADLEVADGYEVDPRTAALHHKALAYAEQHKVDIITAVRAVERQEA
ncbi:peptidase [Sediminicurvatus halobius]|uniref:Peptidase n=1 Tax=Sediminicurvatus halobius TaxID=2182432 RepID=A0A2U2N1C0_9GAMM|nr:peptidase [Spiribacter halobius]PWG62853.1 peptidase [Spiribacter halobius]UEX76996.1 peptidase [Spiribacter halobius]